MEKQPNEMEKDVIDKEKSSDEIIGSDLVSSKKEPAVETSAEVKTSRESDNFMELYEESL